MDLAKDKGEKGGKLGKNVGEVAMIGEVLTGWQEIKDVRNTVYIMVYLVGLCVTLPLFTLITLSQFWMYKFRDLELDGEHTSNGTKLNQIQKDFPGNLNMCLNIPLAVMVITTTIFGWKINPRTRLIASGLLQAVALIGLTVVCAVDTDHIQDKLVWIILVLFMVYGGLNGVYQTVYGGLCGKLPARYFGMGNAGIGLGSFFPSVINIAIVAIDPPIQLVGFSCIGMTVLVLLSTMIFFAAGSKTPYYLKYTEHKQQDSFMDLRDVMTILKSLWVNLFVILLTFTQTISFMPAIAALVRPISTEHTAWNDKFFVLVCSFFLFSFADFIGRNLSNMTKWPRGGRRTDMFLLLSVLLRTVFIFLTMFCNVAPYNRTTEILFKSDWAYAIFVSCFGFSGGYLINISCMLGPQKLPEKLQEMAGSIIFCSIVLGMGVGSLAGPLLVSLL